MNKTTLRSVSAIAALIALLVLASPVFAAKPAGAGDGAGGNSGGNGNGNQGTVKVVDADSGQESETDNEPHVCGFYLVFEAPNGESGTWSIVDWPPTGSGAVVESGAYAVPAGGSFSTGLLGLSAGHYRVNWQGISAQNEKHKTFWVDECDTTPETEDLPTEEPTDQPTDEPTEEPTDQPTDEPTEEPTEEPTDQPTDEPTEEPTDQPTDEPTEEPTDQPTEGEVADSTDGSQPPTDDPDPTEAQQPEEPTQPENDLEPATGGSPTTEELPDSAMTPPVLPGAAAAFTILLLIFAHRALWDPRSRAR